MFGVNDLAQIEIIRRNNRVVGLFLATGLDRSALQWLVDVWEEIHNLSGHRWHLVAPTIRPIDGDPRLVAPNNYNTIFANELATLYGLHRHDLPCIALDTFNEEERQLRIALPQDEVKRRQLIEEIAKFINGRVTQPYEPMTPAQVRSLTEELYNHIQGKAALRALVGWLPRVASVAMRIAPGRPI